MATTTYRKMTVLAWVLTLACGITFAATPN